MPNAVVYGRKDSREPEPSNEEYVKNFGNGLSFSEKPERVSFSSVRSLSSKTFDQIPSLELSSVRLCVSLIYFGNIVNDIAK